MHLRKQSDVAIGGIAILLLAARRPRPRRSKMVKGGSLGFTLMMPASEFSVRFDA
jgi:hypothetical protein